MKISVTKQNGYFEYSYKLVDAICKTHFKQLMNLSAGYNYKDKTGSVAKRNTQKFLELVEKIEKSNTAKARSSYAKTKKAYDARKQNKSTTAPKPNLTYEEYCEDYLDMHLALMSHAQKVGARNSYNDLMRG